VPSRPVSSPIFVGHTEMDLIESVHGRYVHKRRTSVLSCWCSRLIPSNSRVLDVGCGDGQLARLIADKRSDISICGIDVRQRKDSAMLVETFDGKSIPYGKDSFDVVMLVDVIHHADQPITLLRRRRSRREASHSYQGSSRRRNIRLFNAAANGLDRKCTPWCFPAV